MSILSQLREIALQPHPGFSQEEFIIHGQWGFELFFRPNPLERTFHYDVLVYQTLRQGCCYCALGKPTLDPSLMGMDARTVTAPSSDHEIALLDSVYSVFEQGYELEHMLHGLSSEKALQRAEIVADEVVYQLQDISARRKPKVVMVGVVGNIIKKLATAGLEVLATDLEPGLVDSTIHSVPVLNGIEYTPPLVADCDLALVSGMTLATGTMDEILAQAKANNTKVVVFAETGAWLGRELTRSCGVDAVVSESFPFYIFEGQSVIRVHRAKK